MAILVRTQGPNQHRWVYPLGRCCVLGRHAECDVSEIFLDNGSASRFHAQVELDGGRYCLEDKGSRNGTFLNGQRVTGRTPLRDGDRIGIAGVELTFLEEDGPAAPPPPDGVSFSDLAEARPPVSRRAVAAPGAPGPLAGYSGEKLRALVHMLKRLGRSLDVDQTLQELLAGLFAIFPAARGGFVAFTGDETEDIVPRATHFRLSESNQRVRISRTIVRHVLASREAILWADQGGVPALDVSRTLADLDIHSLMCAPLLDGDGNPFGVVQIDTHQSGRAFLPDDLEVMVGAVSHAAVAVRYSKLHEEALRRQAVERDLELARRVQLGLLPENYPVCEGFEFFAHYRAAYEVGGDYYDFAQLPGGRLALVIGDAAGKGVSAALLMAKLSGELKYYLSCESPPAALARMSDSIGNSGTGRFVTLLVTVLDRASQALTILNAGHPAPLRRRADGVVEAIGEAQRGPALGLVPGCRYQETHVPVEPGDLWFAYTDGFTGAVNAREELFGAVRLRQRLERVPPVVSEAGDLIVRDVLAFLGNQTPSDDMCLVGWSRLSDAAQRTMEFNLDHADPTR
jgi:serine phosphatase RsbU (regulator of sigma subunit)